MPSMACEGPRLSSTIFSPYSVGQLLTRKSIARVFDRRILMRPSWGTRRSAMSRRAMTFRRAAILPVSCTGGRRDLFQNAVHAQAHTKHLLVRLEVHIRGAAADRIQQHLVDETHDRRILDVVARDVVAECLAAAAADFERLEIDSIIVAQAWHLGVELLDRLVELALQFVVFDDNRLDRHAGLELDLVDGVQIGRVGDSQEQTLAALEQG